MAPQKILYIQYTDPGAYPSLGHSSRILAQENWKILFLGTQSFIGEPLQFPFHTHREIRRMAFCPPGWLQKFHYLRFCLWVMGWVLRFRPQWIYASDPLSCPLGFLLSYGPRLEVIYHEHDSPSCDGASLWMHLCLWARKKLALRAAICVLPNQQRAERFASEMAHEASVVSVWNCPSQEEIFPPRQAPQGDGLQVLYHGSIVPSRLPLTLLEALALLPDTVRLRIMGYETLGSQGYVQELEKAALARNLDHRIEILKPRSRAETLVSSHDASVGLSLIPTQSEDVNFMSMTGASNKAFDYLACGLALLVSDIPEWKKMYVEPGYGLACDPDDPKSIAGALRWFLDHPRERHAMGERGRERILTEWHYEREFAPVLSQLNGLGAGSLERGDGI